MIFALEIAERTAAGATAVFVEVRLSCSSSSDALHVEARDVGGPAVVFGGTVFRIWMAKENFAMAQAQTAPSCLGACLRPRVELPTSSLARLRDRLHPNVVVGLLRGILLNSSSSWFRVSLLRCANDELITVRAFLCSPPASRASTGPIFAFISNGESVDRPPVVC